MTPQQHMLSVLQLSAGTVFAWAAFKKMQSPLTFARGIEDYGIVTGRGAVILAIMVIVAECAIAWSHLTGHYLTVGATGAFALLTVFAIAVGIVVRTGRRIPCMCFGNTREETSIKSLARIGLLAIAEISVLALSQPRTGDKAVGLGLWTTSELVVLSLTAGSVLVGASWLLAFQELYALVKPRTCPTCD